MTDKAPPDPPVVDPYMIGGLALAMVGSGSLGLWIPRFSLVDPAVALLWLFGSCALIGGGFALYMHSRKLVKDSELVARTDAAKKIAEMTTLSTRLGELAADVAEQLEDQRKAIAELEQQGKEYEQLAAINKDSADAVRSLLTRELKAGERRSRVLSWAQVVAGFILGIVGTLLIQVVQVFLSTH